MSAIWIDDTGAIISEGETAHVDPGSGRGRYRRAFEALQTSGRKRAIASFTFDPTVLGSVVLVPEHFAGLGSIEERGNYRHTTTNDGREDWQRGFDAASRAIASGDLSKTVIARHVTVEADRPIDTTSLVVSLARANPGSFVYHVAGLVGASPELLVRLEDGVLTTNVLAGTALDNDGLAGDKVAEEHELAAQSALEAIEPHLLDMTAVKSTTRQGAMVHAATSIQGAVRKGTTVFDVLADLHPTAAVGGTPADVAVELIREYEPPRGRYAGPVGWFDTNGDGVFAIALRCALIEGFHATLYAGAGLVKGSVRDDELAETELKLQPILDALG